MVNDWTESKVPPTCLLAILMKMETLPLDILFSVPQPHTTQKLDNGKPVLKNRLIATHSEQEDTCPAHLGRSTTTASEKHNNMTVRHRQEGHSGPFRWSQTSASCSCHGKPGHNQKQAAAKDCTQFEITLFVVGHSSTPGRCMPAVAASLSFCSTTPAHFRAILPAWLEAFWTKKNVVQQL